MLLSDVMLSPVLLSAGLMTGESSRGKAQTQADLAPVGRAASGYWTGAWGNPSAGKDDEPVCAGPSPARGGVEGDAQGGRFHQS